MIQKFHSFGALIPGRLIRNECSSSSQHALRCIDPVDDKDPQLRRRRVAALESRSAVDVEHCTCGPLPNVLDLPFAVEFIVLCTV